MKTKGKILRSIAKKRGWKIKEAKASKVKLSDMKGFPKPMMLTMMQDDLIVTELKNYRAHMSYILQSTKAANEFIKFLKVTGAATVHKGIITITFK